MADSDTQRKNENELSERSEQPRLPIVNISVGKLAKTKSEAGAGKNAKDEGGLDPNNINGSSDNRLVQYNARELDAMSLS